MSTARAWRLIVDDRAPGAWNMAVDRAIHIMHARGDVPPTLRVYRWNGPTVTLGAFQSESAVDERACREHGVSVVRRATGGRGVLHDDEITYAVIAGVRDGVPRGVRASYGYLCAGVSAAFSILGVRAEVNERATASVRSNACYLHATAADLSVSSRKLSGSAQVWKGDSVLQHGSFTRTRDIDREAAVFALDDRERASLAGAATTISACLAQCPEYSAITDAVIAGFTAGLGVEFESGRLSDAERALARVFEGETAVRLSGAAPR